MKQTSDTMMLMEGKIRDGYPWLVIYALVRPLLFRLDPERAHALTLGMLRLAGDVPGGCHVLQRLFAVWDARLRVDALGLAFANPLRVSH